MQIYIEGQHTDIQPALHDWITKRFEELNTPHDLPRGPLRPDGNQG